MGKKGAGPTFAKAKVANRVTLDIGGQSVHVLDTHFIASATRSKKYLGRAGKRARMAHYRFHVARLVEVTNKLRGPVVLAGDFNAPASFVPLAPLRRIFTGWHRMATRGGRPIDYVLGHALNLTQRGTVKTHSDHKAVLAEVAP